MKFYFSLIKRLFQTCVYAESSTPNQLFRGCSEVVPNSFRKCVFKEVLRQTNCSGVVPNLSYIETSMSFRSGIWKFRVHLARRQTFILLREPCSKRRFSALAYGPPHGAEAKSQIGAYDTELDFCGCNYHSCGPIWAGSDDIANVQIENKRGHGLRMKS